MKLRVGKIPIPPHDNEICKRDPFSYYKPVWQLAKGTVLHKET
jgi:hypothetical protein